MVAARKIPMRQCIGCREMKEKNSLIRVIRTPEGEILLDDTGKKNGRGAYLCRCPECFQKAAGSRSFSRVFHMEIPEEISAGILEEIQAKFSAGSETG